MVRSPFEAPATAFRTDARRGITPGLPGSERGSALRPHRSDAPAGINGRAALPGGRSARRSSRPVGGKSSGGRSARRDAGGRSAASPPAAGRNPAMPRRASAVAPPTPAAVGAQGHPRPVGPQAHHSRPDDRNAVMPRRASKRAVDRAWANGGMATADVMPRRASPAGPSPRPPATTLRLEGRLEGPRGRARWRPRHGRPTRWTRRTPPGRGPGASGCSFGTAYRIRTGGLRLERAVSWASRRMRRWRLGGSSPDRPA